jgi:protein-disulfide isomerase
MSPTKAVVTLAVPVQPTDHTVGPLDAKVTVIEYGDFECPSCAAAEPAVRQLLQLYGSRIQFVFRHFPLEDAHPHALLAAEAAEAAGAQGAFWPMHDLLLANSPHLARRHLDDYAARIDLDLARFGADLDDEVYRQRVREQQDGGRRSHLRATPTFFVNGVVQDVSGGVRDLFGAVASGLSA